MYVKYYSNIYFRWLATVASYPYYYFSTLWYTTEVVGSRPGQDSAWRLAAVPAKESGSMFLLVLVHVGATVLVSAASV